MQKWLWADTPEKVWLVVKHQKNSHLYLVCFTLMLHLWNHLDSELFKPGCRRPTGNCEFVNGHLGKKQFPRFTCVFSLITRKLTKTNEIVNNTSAQQHFHFLRKMATSGQHSCEQSPFFFFFSFFYTPHWPQYRWATQTRNQWRSSLMKRHGLPFNNSHGQETSQAIWAETLWWMRWTLNSH